MEKLFSISAICISLIMTEGCNSKKIAITSEYIEFSSTPKHLNSFQISRIKVKDNKRPPQNYSEVSGEKFGILTDSTFKIENRIYFTKNQQGLIWIRFESLERLMNVGALQNNNWYLITNLHHLGYNIFVYIDADGKAQNYIDQRTNW